MLYRISIDLRAPLGTPLRSGTLFGHLCWALLDRDGEEALADWLEKMESGERAPFLISDGFPAGLLPRPLLRPQPPAEELSPEVADRLKQRRKAAFVGREDFLRLRRGAPQEAWAEAAAGTELLEEKAVQHAHNRIDRLTGSTPETAGLWFVTDDWSHAAAPRRDIYVESDLDKAFLQELFVHVGESGYGRDTTYGRGLFAVIGIEEERELDNFTGERLVSLSHGVLTSNMERPRYRRTTHFGKLGIRMTARTARPWKRPILLMQPGATFAAEGNGPFGRLLSEVHQDLPEIRFNAWHLAIPYRETVS